MLHYQLPSSLSLSFGILYSLIYLVFCFSSSPELCVAQGTIPLVYLSISSLFGAAEMLPDCCARLVDSSSSCRGFFLFSSSPILLCSCFLFLSFLFLARYLKNRKECIVSFWSATGTITITAALRRLCMIWRNFRGAMRHSTNSLWRS